MKHFLDMNEAEQDRCRMDAFLLRGGFDILCASCHYLLDRRRSHGDAIAAVLLMMKLTEQFK